MHELSVQHNICNNFFELLPLFRLSKISTTHMLFYKKNSCNNEAIPPINLANRNSNSDARLEHRSSSKETVVHDPNREVVRVMYAVPEEEVEVPQPAGARERISSRRSTIPM